MQVLFLSAPLKDRIWGGDYFKKLGRTDSDTVGELWSASAHPQGESIILNGEFEGKKLSEVYKDYPELFNNPKLDSFPILVKLIYAKDPLSVQVHPNDEYALKHENQYGKTEGWLILNTENNASIVMGHNAKNKEELQKYIDEDNYDELLQKVYVNKGEFYPIYAGTIHAIGAGLTILEIQQSSDVTYRFYDYHRKDKDGNERELHVEKAVSVTTYEELTVDRTNHLEMDTHDIWDNEFFKVSLTQVDGNVAVSTPENYAIFTVSEGEFEVEGVNVVLGDSFIVTKKCEQIVITGKGSLIRTDAK